MGFKPILNDEPHFIRFHWTENNVKTINEKNCLANTLHLWVINIDLRHSTTSYNKKLYNL